jgi:hypothetical protein
MVRPIRLFSCRGATPTFPQRDTEGSERSEETEWAGLIFNFNVDALAASGWKRVLRRG